MPRKSARLTENKRLDRECLPDAQGEAFDATIF
jgi:hypothetical protein